MGDTIGSAESAVSSGAPSAGSSPVPASELVRIHRTTVYGALGIGVLSLAVLIPLGDARYALGVCFGLAVGVWNLRGLESSLERIAPENYKSGRNRFAYSRMSRLGIVTGVAILLLVAARDVGLGMVLGVGIFYAVMVSTMVVSLARTRRANLAEREGCA